MGLRDVVIKEARPLPVLLLVDTSGSMANEKINTVNTALKEMTAEFSSIKNAKGKIHVGVITFGNTVEIVQPIDRIENVHIPEFQAAGKTWMGQAIDMAVSMLEDKNQVPERAYTPAMILLSDGIPSDCPGKMNPEAYDFSQWEPLRRLHASERLRKCPKLALGIGGDANYRMLNAFVHNPEVPVIQANELETITKFFRWVTYSISRRSVSSNPNETEMEDMKQMFDEAEIAHLMGLSS